MKTNYRMTTGLKQVERERIKMHGLRKMKLQTKAKMISAALQIWEAHGEKAITARAVGSIVGVSGQRVHRVFGKMQALLEETARVALEENRKSIILQMQASGHPLAPKINAEKLFR